MTESEITAILDQAHECAEGECAVDDVEDLISELKTQQKVLSERLDTIMNAVAVLQAANDSSDRKTGEFFRHRIRPSRARAHACLDRRDAKTPDLANNITSLPQTMSGPSSRTS